MKKNIYCFFLLILCSSNTVLSSRNFKKFIEESKKHPYSSAIAALSLFVIIGDVAYNQYMIARYEKLSKAKENLKKKEKWRKAKEKGRASLDDLFLLLENKEEISRQKKILCLNTKIFIARQALNRLFLKESKNIITKVLPSYSAASKEVSLDESAPFLALKILDHNKNFWKKKLFFIPLLDDPEVWNKDYRVCIAGDRKDCYSFYLCKIKPLHKNKESFSLEEAEKSFRGIFLFDVELLCTEERASFFIKQYPEKEFPSDKNFRFKPIYEKKISNLQNVRIEAENIFKKYEENILKNYEKN